MPDRKKIEEIFSELRNFADNDVHPVVSPENWCVYSKLRDLIDQAEEDVFVLQKEQKVMSPDEFKDGLLKMFSSIWDCEIDHPVFQDTVGELMSAVMQLYALAVKWE